MLTVSSKVLSLSAEAAVLVRAGRIVYANGAAEQLLGADCTGKKMSELFPAEITAAQAGDFTAEATVGTRRCIIRTTKLDDLQAFFLSPPDSAPNLLNDAFFCTMRDALMNYRLAVEVGRERVGLSGDAELLASFRSLQRAAFRIARLLDNAASVRLIAAGELTAAEAALDLASVCRELIDSISLLRPDVSFRYDGDDELWLVADRVLIEQLLCNLISNALLHGAPLTRVRLSLSTSAGKAFLSVTDDGCGIEAEKLFTVFERYSAPYSLDEMGRGAGLGLSVARGIARAHNGTLLLESRPGAGTAVRISLSRRLPTKALRAAEPQQGRGMYALLTGLAEVLDADAFDIKYLD